MKKYSILLIMLVFMAVRYSIAQPAKIQGYYTDSKKFPSYKILLNPDSTFSYESPWSPVFYDSRDYKEKGKWTLDGDTLILNPQLEIKDFVEYDFQEEKTGLNIQFKFSVYHVVRKFDSMGALIGKDTQIVNRYDYAFNTLRRKSLRRVATRYSVRCSLGGGYVPPEILSNQHDTYVDPSKDTLKKIYIGSYELQGIKEFVINDPLADHVTLTIYSNHYGDGLLRQKKILVQGKKMYMDRKRNGKFVKSGLHGMLVRRSDTIEDQLSMNFNAQTAVD